MADVSGSGSAITAKSAASRKFPMQFLCDYANAVLDGKTGELLEYWHLIAHPKHKQAWGASFGNEIGRLALGMPGRVKDTGTMFFVDKNKVPKDRWRRSFGNEIGRLALGMPGRVKDTGTMFFVDKNKVPKDRWRRT